MASEVRYNIRYATTLEYPGDARESQNEVRACPASDDHQRLIHYSISTTPSARCASFDDYWGTRVDAFGVRPPHPSLEITAEASVETRAAPLVTTAPPLFLLGEQTFKDGHVEYLVPSPHVSWNGGVTDAARECADQVQADVVSVTLAIHRFVGTTINYAPGCTEIGEAVEAVLSNRQGVCQDMAHLNIAMCRSLGIPARYVSGYFFAADERTGEDVEDDEVEVQTHAWVEVAVPGDGWLALDPTNTQAVGQRHIKIGHGRDYGDVPPFRGVFSGAGAANLSASVTIQRRQSQQQQQQQQ